MQELVGYLDFDMTGEFINLRAIIIVYSARINPLMQTFVVYMHRVLSLRGGVFRIWMLWHVLPWRVIADGAYIDDYLAIVMTLFHIMCIST